MQALKNPLERDITETVQLYIRDKVGSITRPVKELKGFRQVCVEAGSEMTVELELDSAKLGFYNSELQYVVEPGEFDVMVGPSSDSRSLLRSSFVLE